MNRNASIVTSLLLAIMLFVLGACGRVNTTRTPTTQDGPAGRLSSGAGVAPVQVAPNSEPMAEPTAIRSSGPIIQEPINLPAQLAYAPGAAGGSDNYVQCGNTPLDGSGQDAFSYNGEDRPYLFTTSDHADMGGFVSICYFNFTPGTVEERVVNPDGQTIIDRSFTIDRPKNVDANDFMVLPGDKSGIYTVIATTPNGEMQTQFRVTDARATPKYNSNEPYMTVLGRGPNAHLPATSEIQYLFLSQFAPSEKVDLYFYEYCERLESSGAGWWPYNGTFKVGTQMSVNDAGWATWKIPAEIMQSLNQSLGYYVIARGEHSAAPAGDMRDRSWSNRATVSTYAFTSNATDVKPPACPAAQ